ncbi:hypothetical protein [Agathobaculum desmolans]|uniref:hypothetical protein n=1 Tax=Agathobaculum desmolans TaxID=39484 RepID=UPI00248DE574|nr:hypothetical protein [Agathobaculum desmolans]
MGRRILFFFEVLILLTLFVFFGSLAATTLQNDRIVDITEDFVEVVRYKGCITQSMYEDLLKAYPTPVEVNFEVEKAPALVSNDAPASMQFTAEVVDGIYGSGRIFTMQTGDSIEVVVRKAGPTWFDSMVSAMTASGTDEKPIIAVKGGMILNEQYHDPTAGGVHP